MVNRRGGFRDPRRGFSRGWAESLLRSSESRDAPRSAGELGGRSTDHGQIALLRRSDVADCAELHSRDELACSRAAGVALEKSEHVVYAGHAFALRVRLPLEQLAQHALGLVLNRQGYERE